MYPISKFQVKPINPEKYKQALQIAKLIFNVLLIISGIILFYWIISAVYTKFFKPNIETAGQTEFNDNQGSQSSKNDINILEKKQKATYLDSFYFQLAEKLESLLFTSIGIAKSQDIKPLLQNLKNYTDCLKLNEAWGLRKGKFAFAHDPLTLTKALDEFSDYYSSGYWRVINQAFSKAAKNFK